MTDVIVKLPEPILRMQAATVSNFGTAELKQIVADMFQIMQEKQGVGLAAPQIGISQRIFVYGFDSSARYPNAAAVPKGVAINPEIIWGSEEQIDREEGCLSVPFKRGIVTRAKSITFKYQDLEGKVLEKTLHDFAARIVQHEIDHLNGILYIDLAKEVHDSQLI